MTKIDIFSGFLGAGKTTLIRKLIAEAYKGEKLVLIENEFGEIAVDGGFLQDAGVEITEMNSGCICCTLVGDFTKALQKVMEDYSPDRILIEPSGVGKLSDVAKAVEQVEGTEISAKVTVVDAGKCAMYMRNFGEFFDDQVQNADLIVMSRSDAAGEKKLQQAVELLRGLNAEVSLITTPWAQLDGKQIAEAMETNALKADMESLHHEHEHHHQGDGCCHHHDHEGDGECCHHHEHHDEDSCPHDGEHHHHHDHHHDHDDDGCDCHEHHHDHDDDGCDCHEHHHDHDDDGCDCHEHHHDHDDDGCGCHEHHHDHDDDGCGCHEHHHDHDDGCGCHEHHHDHDDDGCGCHDHHHHHHADEVFTSWGMETAKKFSEAGLREILTALEDEAAYGLVLRAKGIVDSGEKDWLYFDYVPGEIDLRRGGAAVTGRFCVIGSKLNEQALKELFDRG